MSELVGPPSDRPRQGAPGEYRDTPFRFAFGGRGNKPIINVLLSWCSCHLHSPLRGVRVLTQHEELPHNRKATILPESWSRGAAARNRGPQPRELWPPSYAGMLHSDSSHSVNCPSYYVNTPYFNRPRTRGSF